MPRNPKGECSLDHEKVLEEHLSKGIMGSCICPDCDLTLMHDEVSTQEDWDTLQGKMKLKEKHGISKDEDI